MNPIFENPNVASEEYSKMRRKFYNSFYTPKYVLRQISKGYLHGNFYSKIMARTAANYIIWRIMSRGRS
jgi:hypothetical protein